MDVIISKERISIAPLALEHGDGMRNIKTLRHRCITVHKVKYHNPTQTNRTNFKSLKVAVCIVVIAWCVSKLFHTVGPRCVNSRSLRFSKAESSRLRLVGRMSASEERRCSLDSGLCAQRSLTGKACTALDAKTGSQRGLRRAGVMQPRGSAVWEPYCRILNSHKPGETIVGKVFIVDTA